MASGTEVEIQINKQKTERSSLIIPAHNAGGMYMELHELKAMAKTVRSDIVTMVNKAGSGHPGGSLSATDLLVGLYFGDIIRKEEDLLTQLEQQQNEIEDLNSQIQMLSSEKLRLASAVQMQQKKIAQQSEVIESLNESDKQLQNAKELMWNAEKLKKLAEEEKNEAEMMKETYKTEYNRLIREARTSKKKADRLVRDQGEIIKREAAAYARPLLDRMRDKYLNEKEELEEKYAEDKAAYEKKIKILFIYAAVITVLFLLF